MSYTFWHAGVLIGTSDLDQFSTYPGQRGGIFHPTPHGAVIFPRLTGLLSVAHAMQQRLEAKGRATDALPQQEISELLEGTSAGEKMRDLGRMLVDVEVRAPDGTLAEVAALAFSDLQELQRLTREMGLDCAETLAELPPEAPRYIVSATFRSGASRPPGPEHGRTPWRRHWSRDN